MEFLLLFLFTLDSLFYASTIAEMSGLGLKFRALKATKEDAGGNPRSTG